MEKSEPTTVETKNSREFVIDDDDRYARLKLIGWWDHERIAAAKVLVVGAGALGNEVLKNLALLGIGHIELIDMDQVDKTNLTRSILFRSQDEGQPKAEVAAKMIVEVNSDCRVNPIVGNVLTDIGLGLVRDMDVVIGCLDNREARLWVNRMCWKVDTPWIDGGIQEINGVAKVFRPGGACYECTMTEMDYQLISLRYSCPLLKQEDIQQGKVPTAPTIASIIGGLQVQEALKILHDLPAADGAGLVFNGVANRFYKTEYPLREDCLSHETYEEPLELDLAAGTTTVQQLFDAVFEQTKQQPTRLVLDRDFLTQLVCRTCDIQLRVNKPCCTVDAKDGMCASCNMPMQTETVSSIEPDSELVAKKLSELGIPSYDIVKVDADDATSFVLLAGDR